MTSINEQCIVFEDTSNHIDGGEQLFINTRSRRLAFGGSEQGHVNSQINQIDLGPDIQGNLKFIVTTAIMRGRFDSFVQSGFEILNQKAIFAFNNKNSNTEEKRQMICFVLRLKRQEDKTIQTCICYILHPMVFWVDYIDCKITKDSYKLNGMIFIKKDSTPRDFELNGTQVKRYNVNRLGQGTRKFPYTIMEVPPTNELNAGCLIEQNFYGFLCDLGVTSFPDKLLKDEEVGK